MDYTSDLVLRPSDLPVLPKSTWRIIQACAKEDQDSAALGSLVSQDPVLSAELLKVVNSAYFGYTKAVSSIAKAVTIIGTRALRNMVLCLSVRNVYQADQLPSFPLQAFWESAIWRAVCARCLASHVKLDEDVCFTAGLLLDFGLLVLFRLNHHRISEWESLMLCLPDQRYELERQLFGRTHDQVGLHIARAWDLPDELCIPLGYHHRQTSPDMPRETLGYCRLMQCADWMVAVFQAEDKRQAVLGCLSLLSECFDLTRVEVDELLEKAAQQVSGYARLLGIQIAEPENLHQVMREANLQLVEENLSYQELTWRLEHALEERDRVAEELHHELELAREVQRSLLPSDNRNTGCLVGLNVSAKMMSGDFYDFFRVGNGKVVFCIADVSGKGMHAALLMVKASSLFRFLAKGIQDPTKLLAILNREILETSIRGMFITMIVGVYEPTTRRVRLANAGHLPAIRMRGTDFVAEYPATAPPLGIHSQAGFPSVEFDLGSHSLYLFTDGLPDAFVNANSRLGRKGLESLLTKYVKTRPTERLQQIVGALRKNSVQVNDDLTILLLEGEAPGESAVTD